MKLLPGKRAVLFLAVAAVMLLPLAANATTLYSGFLDSSSGGGVTATQNWDNGGFKIAWSINDDEGFIGGLKVFDYTYTITITDGLTTQNQLKALSHLILEVSTVAVAANFFDLNASFTDGDPQIYSGADSSNPNMPNPIFGLKFDAAGNIPVDTSDSTKLVYTLNFDSFRSPVLGSFYAKDGKTGAVDVTAWNTGLADVNGQFIYVPDTQVFVPIPPSALLLGSGLLGLGLIGWRRKSQQ